MEATIICSVRLCRNAAQDKSPITCQPLCHLHLQSDLAKMQKSEAAVAERIAHFKKYTTPLRLMQQRLTSDLQLLDDTFQELRDTLDKRQKELVDVITQQHDQLLDSLNILSELDEFEKELRTAKEQNDMRQVFILNESMEKSLETMQLDSKLVSMDEGSQQVRMAAYPDVNTHVMDLKPCITAQLKLLQVMVESLDVTKPGQKPFADMKNLKTKIGLDGKAVCVALCSNTNGFKIDANDKIVRAESSPGGQPLTQPSTFVVSESSQPARRNTGAAGDGQKSYIQVLSTDRERLVSLPCSWDPQQPIRDLHCDSHRQQLFIAQQHAVTVTDLCGVSQSQIKVSDLEDGAQEIVHITGDSDKLFVAARDRDGQSAIFGVSKESAVVQLKLPVTCVADLSELTRIDVCNRTVRLCTQTSTFTVCTITGQVIQSNSVADLSFLGSGIPEECAATIAHFGSLYGLVQSHVVIPVGFPISALGQATVAGDGARGLKLVLLETGGVFLSEMLMMP